MSVAASVRQPLQQQQADALAPARAVRGSRERLAAPVRCHPALAAELHERTRRRHHGHTTGERQRTLTRPQRLRRQMQRHQRRRTRRVHRHRRTLQPEHVRETARHHTSCGAGQQIAVGGVRVAAVALEARADEDTGGAGPESGVVQARAFEQLPRGLQQQPLLRIHAEGLARTDPEQFGVEVGHVLDEAAFAGVRLARPTGLGVVQFVDRPATVPRKRRDGVRPVGHQPPQVLGAAYPARKPAAHRHHGDRLVLARLVPQEAFPRLLQLTGYPLEVFEQLVLVRHHILNRRSPTGLVAVSADQAPCQ
ncbi:hypothetical protein Sgri01_07169 [Streptomyces griseus]